MRQNVIADNLPRAPEAKLGFAAIAETRVGVREGDIRNPVAYRVRTTEGEDNCLVGVVDCDEAGGVGDCRADEGLVFP